MASPITDKLRISGKIRINTYRAGMVDAIRPILYAIEGWKTGLDRCTPNYEKWARAVIEDKQREIQRIKSAHFIRTAVECPNLIMGSTGYGLDIIIQRLVGINTYSLNIMFGEIGTGTTTPTLMDTGLTTPTNRAAVGFQQDFGSTDAIVQFFFADSQLANQTYNEFGTFIDGSSTIGSGQIFNHALLSPGYTKVSGQDTTVQVDIAIANS